LQWVVPQLGDAAVAAADSGRSSCGEDGCWEVLYERGLPTLEMGAPDTSTVPARELELALARINAKYPYPGTSRIPAKVAVTQLSETAMDIAAEHAIPVGEARDELLDVHPSFMRALPPSASDVGTAAHKLLAAMAKRGLGHFADGQQIYDLRSELVRRGLLARAHAEAVSLAQLSQCADDLARTLPQLLRQPCQTFIELPVNLLVPAREIAIHELVDPVTVGDELVHVQGALDLLLDDGQTALIVDYKTGYTTDPDALRRLHEEQLLWYCRAVSLLLPGRRVRWALYGLGGAGLVGPFDYHATEVSPTRSNVT